MASPSALPSIGVVVHVFDRTEAIGHEFRPKRCPHDAQFAVSQDRAAYTPEEMDDGCAWGSADLRMHVSASCVFAGHAHRRQAAASTQRGGGAVGGARGGGRSGARGGQIPLFQSGGEGGLIFAPGAANCLSCAWSGDGGTMGRACHPAQPAKPRGLLGSVRAPPGMGAGAATTGCVSGCVSQATAGGESALDPKFWCSEARAAESGEGAWCSGRPWRPTELGAMLRWQPRAGYNELILLPDCWRANLPHSVEALFYPKARCTEGSPCRHKLRSLHQLLRSQYGKYAPPLLSMDLSDWDAPFAVDGQM